MPGTHAPIKKYNYERSLFRWVMSRHPEPFEAHGITTKTLERAPLAREAFYTSNWPGAKVLVHCSHDIKYERTAFFDAIIERGLRDGTRFNVDHVTSEERSKLGITMDRASGKYYLSAYGSARGRRNSTRRGSVTSSEGDLLDQHPVVRELGDLLHSEIEAAGDNAGVSYKKSRCEPGSAHGSTVLTFSVTIQPRDGGGGDSGGDSGRGAVGSGGDSGSRAAGLEGAGAGAAADAGGGNPNGKGAPQQSERPAGSASSSEARRQQQQQRQPGSKKRDTATVAAAAAAAASVAQGGKKPKVRGRPGSHSNSKSNPPGSMGAECDGGGVARDAGAGADEPPKRRRSSIHSIFSNNAGLGTLAKLGMAKMEPVPQLSSYSTLNGGGGGPSRMDTSYGPSSLESSHSGTSTTTTSRGWPQHQSQPVMAFGEGSLSGSRSFWPGMGVMPQPLQHGPFQAASASSSPSSASSSSCSSPQQYGAGATAGGGAAQRSTKLSPRAWIIPYSVPRNAKTGIAAGSSGASLSAQPSSGGGAGSDAGGTSDAGGGGGRASSNSWQLAVRNGDGDFDSQERHSAKASGAMNGRGGSMGRVAEVGGPEAGGGSKTAGAAAATGGRLGGGGGLLPPMSQGYSGGGGGFATATLLDHPAPSQSHSSRPQSQSHSQSQDVSSSAALKPYTSYTKRQSLSQQAANGGGGSAHAVWGGAAAVRTAGTEIPALHSTGGGGVETGEFDFLEVFF